MATLKLVQENFSTGETAIRIYASFKGGWGSQVVDLKGSPYSEQARDFTEIGRIDVPEADLWAGDYLDFPGAIRKHRASLQGVADLHFRGTQTRLVI
jgi:hypothetical protein